MRYRNGPRIAPVIIGISVLLTVWLAAPESRAQLHGQCVAAEIDAPVVLPDGSQHPAGSFKVCFERRLSPVTGLHHLYVEGMPVSMSISRCRRSEGLSADGEPLLLFFRSQTGRLRLEGYAVPAGKRMVVFEFQAHGQRADVEPNGYVRRGSEEMVLVAARTH